METFRHISFQVTLESGPIEVQINLTSQLETVFS